MKSKFLRTNLEFLAFILLTTALSSCDREHLNKCEWYLIPDQDRKSPVQDGYIPVCARNYKVVKQDCRLQATFEFAEKAYNRKFRFKDMKVDGPGIPRTVKSIRYCEGDTK